MRTSTGRVVAMLFGLLLAAAADCRAKNEFSLNFNNVDIRTFIRFVSEFTGSNYVLDPSVRGNITVYSQKAVPVEDLDKIFRTILHLYGFTVVEETGVYVIIPIADGKTRSGQIGTGKPDQDQRYRFITQIIPLQYYPASALTQILNPYVTKGGQLIVDERTNSLILSDIGSNIARIAEIIAVIDTAPPPGKEQFKVYRLENANSEDVAKVLNEILSKKKVVAVRTPVARTPGAGEIQPSVVAAKATNSLIVYAHPDDFDTISSLLKELDVMTNQVLIEALIAEVSQDKAQEIGINWDVLWDLDDRYVAEANLNLAATTTTGGLKVGVTKGTTDIGGLIQLYGRDSRFNILSTPQIVTMDNHEAEINVSENRPYLKEVRFPSGSTGTTEDTIESYDYKDVGIVLKITPQISQDRYVKLKITESVTKVMEGVGPKNTLTTAKREASTTVIVPNNRTVVLGGLIRKDTSKAVEKVPLLGDIPGLGHLFRKTVVRDEKTNLMIFLTPRIITSFEEAERIREEKHRALGGARPDGKR